MIIIHIYVEQYQSYATNLRQRCATLSKQNMSNMRAIRGSFCATFGVLICRRYRDASGSGQGH